jgi:hypothetical protein
MRPEGTIWSIARDLQHEPSKILRARGRDLEAALNRLLPDFQPSEREKALARDLEVLQARMSEWGT